MYHNSPQRPENSSRTAGAQQCNYTEAECESLYEFAADVSTMVTDRFALPITGHPEHTRDTKHSIPVIVFQTPFEDPVQTEPIEPTGTDMSVEDLCSDELKNAFATQCTSILAARYQTHTTPETIAPGTSLDTLSKRYNT